MRALTLGALLVEERLRILLCEVLYSLRLRRRPPAFVRDPLSVTRREMRYAIALGQKLARERGWKDIDA